MEWICVYCGSSQGRDPAYVAAAERFGRTLARRDLGLVYGGGQVGLMGAVADATLAAGGEAHGVIPEALDEREFIHQGLTRLDVVESMHVRKERMTALADGFVALPGGFGTLEELMEALAWAQLGFHRKPCGVLNVAGYYTDLAEFFDQQVAAGFVEPDHRDMLIVADDAETLLDRFAAYEPPPAKQVETDEPET